MRNLVFIVIALVIAGGGAVFYFKSGNTPALAESEHERLLKDAQEKNKQFYTWPEE